MVGMFLFASLFQFTSHNSHTVLLQVFTMPIPACDAEKKETGLSFLANNFNKKDREIICANI